MGHGKLEGGMDLIKFLQKWTIVEQGPGAWSKTNKPKVIEMTYNLKINNLEKIVFLDKFFSNF